MSDAIVEITTQALSTDVPREYITNHFAFNTGASATIAQFQALADAVLNIWKRSPGPAWGWSSCKLTVNAYDRADPKPRPEKGHSLYVPGSWLTSTAQARQVALCVSFYAQRNLPRQRGRVYLFPGNNAGASERPGTAVMNAAMQTLLDLSAATLALTPSWTHEVWSQKAGQTFGVDNYWVNDVWDTQRRRAPKETVRVHHP